MRNWLWILPVLVPALAGAADNSDQAPATAILTQTNFCEKGSALQIDDDSKEQIARRGCCSHHGGVCGCLGGRQVCCEAR